MPARHESLSTPEEHLPLRSLIFFSIMPTEFATQLVELVTHIEDQKQKPGIPPGLTISLEVLSATATKQQLKISILLEHSSFTGKDLDVSDEVFCDDTTDLATALLISSQTKIYLGKIEALLRNAAAHL